MKPSWENAPRWARYLIMDKNHDWWWFETLPAEWKNDWMALPGRKEIGTAKYSADDTLEVMPEKFWTKETHPLMFKEKVE